MILILLSWCYIFFTAVTFGIAFSKLLRMQLFDAVVTPVLGLFSVTILATIWAFFGPISVVFNIILTVLSVLFWYNNKRTFTSIWQNALTQIQSYSKAFKILLIVSSLLILAQSATLPFIIDNESYYIQTIKWLNEYGFVKGLANLHLFFGQTSGWHVTQSVYSLSFLYDRFNDLNGFCLLLANFFAFQKLHSYFTKGSKIDLIFGLLPLTYAFLFQFVSSPSPDFPIYIFGFLLFSTYLQQDKNEDSFIIISILAFFAFFIKITGVILLLFPLVLLVTNFKTFKKTLFPLFGIGSLVLLLFVLKNIILSGYPLFPLLCFRLGNLDYTVPSIIMDFFFNKNMLNSFYIDSAAYTTTSLGELPKYYFLRNGIAGFIGLASLMILLITPFVILKRRIRGAWTIYFGFIILAVLLASSSPQYRFYIYFTLFFILLIASEWITNHKLIMRLTSISLFVVAVLVFIPMSFGSLTANTFLAENSTFHFKDIAIPEPNTKWNQEFKGSSVGNMMYQTPVDDSFFWVTGNGKLPCVNKKQVEYFHYGFFFIPQQRSIKLKDGFYSQKVGTNE